MQLIFATANQHKLHEAQAILGEKITLITPADLGYAKDILETGDTLEENALLKARTIWQALHQDCFADDTGLEVAALNGAPGVHSARYAGEPVNMPANIAKLLQQLALQGNRSARFRCVIALILHGTEYLFEGIIPGEILAESHGTQGFGYDPVFKPLGFKQSFAQMSVSEKNGISHRSLALQQLQHFLNRH